MKILLRGTKEVKLQGNMNHDCGKINKIMSNAANECNKHVNIWKKDWFDEECQQEIEEKTQLRTEMITKEREKAKNKYEKQRKQVAKVLRLKKKK